MEEFERAQFWSASRLQAEIEQGFDIVVEADPARFAAFAPTGERYVTIGHQVDGLPSEAGTVDEGKERETAFDAETAYWAALGAFRQYAEGKTGKLYWRSPPNLEWSPKGKSLRLGNRCLFWIRLLISDKPVMAKAA